MTKSPMKYMVRAWDKELKKAPWNMRSRKHRKACARDFAGASIEMDGGADIRNQDDADYAVAEELTHWND